MVNLFGYKSVPHRKYFRSGFTLVELLVVIGIIAILAGVALGPITRAMKSAAHSKGLQTSRTLALAEFQYANDNNLYYPDQNTANSSGTANATAVAYCLMAGGYISDPSIFLISGSSETLYSGSLTSPSIKTGNISWDFAGASGGTGVNPNAPDTMPLVWSTVGATAAPNLQNSGAISITLTSSMPFGTGGIAVCYKSNSASFVTATSSSSTAAITTAAYPGWSSATVLSGGANAGG